MHDKQDKCIANIYFSLGYYFVHCVACITIITSTEYFNACTIFWKFPLKFLARLNFFNFTARVANDKSKGVGGGPGTRNRRTSLVTVHSLSLSSLRDRATSSDTSTIVSGVYAMICFLRGWVYDFFSRNNIQTTDFVGLRVEIFIVELLENNTLYGYVAIRRLWIILETISSRDTQKGVSYVLTLVRGHGKTYLKIVWIIEGILMIIFRF